MRPYIGRHEPRPMSPIGSVDRAEIARRASERIHNASNYRGRHEA